MLQRKRSIRQWARIPVLTASFISRSLIGKCYGFSFVQSPQQNCHPFLPNNSHVPSSLSSPQPRGSAHHNHRSFFASTNENSHENLDSKRRNQGNQSSQPRKQDANPEHSHPHSNLWTSTLESSPNSFINPSIHLAIRPPAEGGTGIVAVESVSKDTVVMCLDLEEVPTIDVGSILFGEVGEIPECHTAESDDSVMDMLRAMWKKEMISSREEKGEDTQEGKRLAVLAGIIAHLQLARYKDLVLNRSSSGGIIATETIDSTSTAATKASPYRTALEQSRRLGSFLDAMPLLPRIPPSEDGNQHQSHPFPTHFLYWTDEEVENLLKGTMALTKAREVRAGVGLVIREWSESFLKEHSSSVSQSQILDAILSSFTCVLSRSFGDAAGRDLDGKGRMLVPLVDMLNHDGEDPNVSWKWHVGEIIEGKTGCVEESKVVNLENETAEEELLKPSYHRKGNILVTTISDVPKGIELLKCYGWRPAWDIASSYGFVPQLKKERWECAVIPLFPAMLQVGTGGVIENEKVFDMLLETNYGPIVKAVLAAVNAANEIQARQTIEDVTDVGADETPDSDRPTQLDRLEVVSLFRPPPAMTADDFPFPRRQPCVVVGTKIHSSSLSVKNKSACHRRAIHSILPAYRAASSALEQLRQNHQNANSNNDAKGGGSSPSPIQASQMAIAAASFDKNTHWNIPAIELIKKGIQDRIQSLITDGDDADRWLKSGIVKADCCRGLNRSLRASVAKDAREAELSVLRDLEIELINFKI